MSNPVYHTKHRVSAVGGVEHGGEVWCWTIAEELLKYKGMYSQGLEEPEVVKTRQLAHSRPIYSSREHALRAGLDAIGNLVGDGVRLTSKLRPGEGRDYPPASSFPKRGPVENRRAAIWNLELLSDRALEMKDSIRAGNVPTAGETEKFASGMLDLYTKARDAMDNYRGSVGRESSAANPREASELRNRYVNAGLDVVAAPRARDAREERGKE